jgi:allophanate hydrolase
MPLQAFGSFVALIPAPLGIGTLCLDDGTTVLGFLCESYAVRDAIEITDHGGWRAWLAQT